MGSGKVNFFRNSSSVELNLNDVGLLLATAQYFLLSVANDANNLAILFDLKTEQDDFENAYKERFI